MRLARSRATDQHHVLCGLGKLKRGQLFDQRLIHLRLTKVEVCQATVNRETRRVHLGTSGSGLSLSYPGSMARPLRLELAGALYHVTSRGDGREDIFLSDDDRLAWLETLT